MVSCILQQEFPFTSSSLEKFSSIAPPWPSPNLLCNGMECICVCMYVCLVDMASLSHECWSSHLNYERSPFRLMTDTWWPLLRMDVWLLTHFWLPLYRFLALWPDLFRCIVLWKAIFEMSTLSISGPHAQSHSLGYIYCVCVRVRFSLIMDHVVNNAAEGSHCATFSHGNSFSLCRSFSLSLPLPSSGHPYKTISFVPIDPVCQHLHSQYKV